MLVLFGHKSSLERASNLGCKLAVKMNKQLAILLYFFDECLVPGAITFANLLKIKLLVNTQSIIELS